MPDPKTGCILWTGGLIVNGYGLLGVNRRTWYAHRLAWTIAHGPIPNGLYVCRRCDVPACINPKHLFLGTHKENMADRVVKTRRRGEDWKGYATKRRKGPKRPPPPKILRIFFQGQEIVSRVLRVQKPGRREF
jgi:hypothetical protein